MYKAEFPLNYTPPEDASNTEALCNILRENMVNYFLGNDLRIWLISCCYMFKLVSALIKFNIIAH